MKLRKGDTVKVIAGGNFKKNQDKGKTGEIIAVDTKHNKVTVSGVHIVVKHHKPDQRNPEGSITTAEGPIDASNVAYYDEKTKEIVKIGYAVINGKKERINKKTGLPLGKKAPKAAKKDEAKKVEAKEEVKAAPAAEKKPAAAKKPAAEKKPATEKKAPAKKAPAKKEG